jgi:hypothetical protein
MYKNTLEHIFSRNRRFTAVRYLTDVKSDVWVISPAPLDMGNKECASLCHSKHL